MLKLLNNELLMAMVSFHKIIQMFCECMLIFCSLKSYVQACVAANYNARVIVIIIKH